MSGQVPPIFVSSAAPVAELAQWASALPSARAVVAIGSTWKLPTLTRGRARDAAELAYELHALLPIMRDDDRDPDEEIAAPLAALASQKPVVELSLLLGATPRALFAIGRKIGVLAARGVLIAGFGSFREANDAWIANTLADAALQDLLEWRKLAPSHDPAPCEALFVVAGAASLYDHALGFPVRGASDGASARCIQFGR